MLERFFEEVKRRMRVVGVLPQRVERSDFSDGDSIEEQRGVGAHALPHDGRPRSSRETEPTTFETLTDTVGLFNEGASKCVLAPIFEF
jgi:hypothetical protein